MSDHEWCRDVRRDESVRAAEDAAAVPAIQHRDLPEQVALLWASVGDIIGRVVRLEGEMDAGQDQEAAPGVCDSASPAEGLRTERVTPPWQRAKWDEALAIICDGGDWGRGNNFDHGVLGALVIWADKEMDRLTAERDAAIRERDAAKEECERLGHIVSKYQETRQWDIEKIEDGCVRICFGDHHRAADCEWEYFIPASREADLQYQRSGAIRERDEARRERDEAVDDGETLRMSLTACDVIANSNTSQSLSCNRIIHPNYDCEAVQSVIRAVEREIALRDRVSELESAAAANAGGEQQPEAWGVRWHGQPKIDFDFVYEHEESAADIATDDGNNGTVVPLYAAPQPPRGWLTADERELIAGLADDDVFTEEGQNIAKALLARETPPRVRKVNCMLAEETHDLHAWKLAETMWIAAIRDAGGEVEG